MTLTEAQDQSPVGVAVYGNPAMRDVIWRKDDPYPCLWVGDGYVVIVRTAFGDPDAWSPIDETDFVIKYRKRAVE